MDNGTKCSAFWKHTNLRPGNRIYPCCRFKQSIADFDGDVENILNIPEYEELRRASTAGEKIKGCEKCYYEESIGHKSLREEFNEKYDTEKVELEYLEIGLDNLCNLACIGCNSEFSTRWIQKEIDTLGFAMNKYMAVSDINRLPHTIKKILFLGGEPLLTKRFIPMLQSLNKNRNIQVIFNTNGTCIPDNETVGILSKFNTHFILSIDGINEMANKVREGTDWAKVTEFIAWTGDQGFSIEINTVLHKANWWDIENIANFVNQLDAQWYVNILTNPGHLDIQNLDNYEKSKLVSLINNCNLPNQDLIINHLFQTIS